MSTVPALFFALATAATPAPRGEIIDFSARWCGPCQQVAPLVARLEREGEPIRTVDVDAQRDVAQRFKVTAMPTFVLLIDGKEVDRNVGAMSEAQLRAWLGRIPQPEPAETAAPATAAAPARSYVADPNVRLGTPQPIQNALAGGPVPASEQASASAAPARAFPDAAAESPAGMEVRATDALIENAGDEAVTPMDASVRLRVTINGHINLGSGTIVECTGERARIVTCGHIFRGFTEGSRIEVNLFRNGQEQSMLGELVKFDLASDVGLIQIATPERLPTAPVARAPQGVQVNESVINIGCSGGQPPTREELSVTAVNPYEGPDNLECSGVPVQGRSGGGLFKASGELVGVCIAADPNRKRGVYAGLLAVHELLGEAGLAYLYEPPAARETPVALAANTQMDSLLGGDATADSRSALLDSPAPAVTPASRPAAVAAHPPRSVPQASGLAAPTGDAEIVCIIRPRNQPGADTQVVIIHEASPKLMSYLRGEISPGSSSAGGSAISNVRATSVNPAPLVATSRELRPDDAETVSAARPTLLPTALSRQHSPRAYVRSEGSRLR
jgi:thiol-disulfide isomerase/thioredoxin